MAATQFNTDNISSVQRNDFDTTTTGQAVITKALPGNSMTSTYTGIDQGTGDVTMNFDSTNGVNLSNVYRQGYPAIPTNGVTIYPYSMITTRHTLGMLDKYGNTLEAQPSFDSRRVSIFETSWNNGSFSGTGIASNGMTVNGTVGVYGWASTNIRSLTKRVSLTSPATTAGQSGGIRYGSGRMVWRGNAAGLGGFYVSSIFAIPPSPPTGYTFYVGLYDTLSLITATVNPSTLFNIIGIGKDTADTNFQFMYNDSSGVATKVDTGLTPDTTTAYIVRIYCNPNDTGVYVSLQNMTPGSLPAEVFVNTNIPTSGVSLTYHLNLSNNTTAVAAVVDFGRLYVETFM